MKYIVNIDPYELELLVFTTKNSLKRYCNKYMYNLVSEGEDINLDTVAGLSLVYLQDNALLLLLPEEYDEAVLDHELIHITWFVSSIIGQPMTWDNNEFQAYLFTDLKKKIKKKIWKRS